MSLYSELRRRNVLRVGFAYLAGSWLLIQIVETLLPIFGLPESSARLIVVVLAVGFVPVLILAWIFEFTAEGLVRDEDDPRTAMTKSTRTIDRSIMILLLLAFGYFSVDKFVLDPVRDADNIATAIRQAHSDGMIGTDSDKSIAVLPFLDMSADGDQQYFSDGIAEEVLNLLARVRELRVISRSSSFSFRDDQEDIPTIARQLNVAHILEGSVRKSGDRVRITAQLIDARTDTHLWSQTYDRTLDDIFAIQDEIAADVVDQLKLTLLGVRPTIFRTNPKTYALYLEARHIWNHRLSDRYDRGEALLKEALELDDQYVPAWMVLANIYLGQTQTGERKRAAGRLLIREIVQNSSNIDPNYTGVLDWRAWIALAWDGDLAAAARLFEQSLAIEPGNPATLRVVLVLLRALGRISDAVEVGEFSTMLDPLCVSCYRNLMQVYTLDGRVQDTIETVAKLRELGLGSTFIKREAGVAFLLTNKPQRALEEFLNVDSINPGPVIAAQGSAIAYFDLGRLDESQIAQDKFLSMATSNQRKAELYAWIGENDLAFESLRESEPGCCNFDAVLLRKLHTDPRWPGFLKEYARPAEELAEIKFEYALPDTIGATSR